MADTSQTKKDIRDIAKRLSNEFNTNFYEGNILGSKESIMGYQGTILFLFLYVLINYKKEI